MSESTIYDAKRWAEGRSDAELQARIEELEETTQQPARNYEFDDVRLRHKTRVRLRTLRGVLQSRRRA
jgi:hypothetical protein